MLAGSTSVITDSPRSTLRKRSCLPAQPPTFGAGDSRRFAVTFHSALRVRNVHRAEARRPDSTDAEKARASTPPSTGGWVEYARSPSGRQNVWTVAPCRESELRQLRTDSAFQFKAA